MESLAREMHFSNQLLAKERRRKIRKGLWKAFCWTIRNAFRHRRKLAPLYVAIALQIAGVVAAGQPDGIRTVLLCAVLGVGLLWFVGRKRQWQRFRRWFYAITYAASSAVLLAMARFGAGPPMPGVLLAGALASGIPWWWHNRNRDPQVSLDDRLMIWETVVSCPNGVLPDGTDLLAIEPISAADLDPTDTSKRKKRNDVIGWSARVQLPPGKGTTAKIVAAAAEIAACYDLPVDAVIAEPTVDRSARSARLLVLDKHNPTHDAAIYDESWAVLVDGCYPTGVFPDGTRAWRRLFKPLNGPVHELYSGDSGSGKSRGMEAAITQSVMTGLVIPFVGDPQRGQSMPAWAGVQGKAVWAARSVEGITDMLYAAFG